MVQIFHTAAELFESGDFPSRTICPHRNASDESIAAHVRKTFDQIHFAFEELLDTDLAHEQNQKRLVQLYCSCLTIRPSVQSFAKYCTWTRHPAFPTHRQAILCKQIADHILPETIVGFIEDSSAESFGDFFHTK